MPKTKASNDTLNNVNTFSNTMEEPVKPKRRGRPPLKRDETKSAPKKRGRKPKGGKIISNNTIVNSNTETKENIIVHLKCNTSLLTQQKAINSYEINHNKEKGINYFNINKDTIKVSTLFQKAVNINEMNVNDYNNTKSGASNTCQSNTCQSNTCQSDITSENYYHDNATIHVEQKRKIIQEFQQENEKKRRKHENKVMEKLKDLQQKLTHDNVCLTESNCFWCTCSFENPPIHIPKHIIKETYHVYGCFCSPECATAFLFNESIDNSTRFERYSLLCSLYANIFKYDKNIKPAPNPYYTLNKFCGNLSIMEYRELFNSNRFLFVIDKPLTLDLPQLDIMDDNVFN